MATRSLLSASDIKGVYTVENQELKLSATLKLTSRTWGIQFLRVPWIGAIKYELVGWTELPIPDPIVEPFDQTFNHVTFPRELRVLIADKEHPNGIPVDIKIIGGPIDFGDSKEAVAAPSTLTNLNEVLPTVTTIKVLYKEKFQISLPADVPKFGQIRPHFDQSFLTLVDASIIDNNIVWTFLTDQTGSTQVIIDIYGGIATYVLQKVYDIDIFLPLEPGLPGDKKIGYLSFLQHVGIARGIVDAEYQDVDLYNVAAKTNIKGGVDSVDFLTNFTVLFKVKGGYVTIESTGYWTWNKPVFVGHNILGNDVIPWPVDFTPEEATKLLYAEGYTGNFTSVELVRPLFPVGGRDFYVFSMVDGKQVWIDGLLKKVTIGGPNVPQNASK
jgi:hypothetical protein